MKIFELLRLKGVAQALLGLLGILLAVSVALVVLDGMAIFRFADTSSSGAAAANVLLSNAGGNAAAVAAAGGLIGVDVNSEPGALLLVGSGIAGFVFLAVRRRRADIWKRLFPRASRAVGRFESGERTDLALPPPGARK